MRSRNVSLVPMLVLFAVLLKGAAAATAVAVEVIPPLTVARAGATVTVQCRVGRKLQYCRIEHVSPTTPARGGDSGARPSWNLRENSQTPDGVSYAGSGLDAGQCGFTVRRLPANFNGGFRCTMGFPDLTYESIGNFNITVAEAPRAPELVVTKPSSGSSRPGSDYGRGWGERYPTDNEFSEGDTLSAHCAVRNARPAANISWFLDDQEIYQGLTAPLVSHTFNTDLYTVEQNLTMQLSWRHHGKTLKCVAGHIASEENNTTGSGIRVRFAPRPHSTSIEQFGFVVGLPGEIPVEVNANPKPDITWKINEDVLKENSELDGHFNALSLMNNGSGSWTAVLRITDVTHQDIEREYTLQARNVLGEETYRIRLSTSSEPSVMSLEAGAIIGIVVAILVLLLAIFLLVFARTTGRWCFAASGGRGKTSHSSSEAHIDPEKNTSTQPKGEGEGGTENPSANHNVSSEYINGNQDIKKSVKDDKDTPV